MKCEICGNEFADHPFAGRPRKTCGDPQCQKKFKAKYMKAYNQKGRDQAVRGFGRRRTERIELTNDPNMELAIYAG